MNMPDKYFFECTKTDLSQTVEKLMIFITIIHLKNDKLKLTLVFLTAYLGELQAGLQFFFACLA